MSSADPSVNAGLLGDPRLKEAVKVRLCNITASLCSAITAHSDQLATRARACITALSFAPNFYLQSRP